LCPDGAFWYLKGVSIVPESVNKLVGEYGGDYEATGSQCLPILVPAVAVIRGARALGIVIRRKGSVGHRGVSGVSLTLPLGVKSAG